MTLSITYESDGFPAGGPVANSTAALSTSWDKLLWAALTVGRPNRHYVFQHGRASVYEALFRLSLVRMTLEPSSPYGRRLRRTAAAKSLDPTEKGAVNYFLGMAVAKLFAAELLATPWMLHLDVFRSQLSAVLKGRSRPDLIGQNTSGGWIALECKGRLSPPNEDARAKAKVQARRVKRIDGARPSSAIGAITYFRNDILQFFWRDPEVDPHVKNGFELAPTDKMWDYCYSPVRALIHASKQWTDEGVVWGTVPGADVKVGVHHRVWKTFDEGGAAAKRVANELKGELGLCNADGIAVSAGESWAKRFVDTTPESD